MTVKEHGPDPVDVHVGSRVRLRRTLLGMNQTVLGKALGVTYQQTQKYERGANRISAGRLYQLSNIMDVPISFFFDDMPEDITIPTQKKSVLPIVKRLNELSREDMKTVHALVNYLVAHPKEDKL